MRTTLDIDDDILQAARELARRERRSLGSIVSTLARQGLAQPARVVAATEPAAVYGFRPFASRGGVVTNEMIDQLRDDDAY